jgi:GTP cyclohydrolase I
MIDVQNEQDHREIAINKVGVRDIRFPITVLDRDNREQQTVATISMSVDLAHAFKGTHMSRFIEVLNAHAGVFTMHTLPSLLDELRERLHAETAHIELTFPYFVMREAPVTRAAALMDYECKFEGARSTTENDFVVTVSVPVTSLCPCSKAISDYGAHNQRGKITISVRSLPGDGGTPQLVWIEELIAIAESAASAPVYPLIKRADERYITMQAYDRPAFVEDMVRDVAVQLQRDDRVKWFSITAVNDESIHNHSAFAHIESSNTVEEVALRATR